MKKACLKVPLFLCMSGSNVCGEVESLLSAQKVLREFETVTRNMFEGKEESSVQPSPIILCTKAQQKTIDLVARPGGIFVGK